jgi:hypothetical protein
MVARSPWLVRQQMADLLRNCPSPTCRPGLARRHGTLELPPHLLRHQEAEVPVEKVVRLPAGTVYQFRHLELQRRRATRPR